MAIRAYRRAAAPAHRSLLRIWWLPAAPREICLRSESSMNVGEATHVMLYCCYKIAPYRTFLIARRSS